MKIQYFFDDGTEEVASESLTRITAFHDGSSECPIPPVPSAFFARVPATKPITLSARPN